MKHFNFWVNITFYGRLNYGRIHFMWNFLNNYAKDQKRSTNNYFYLFWISFYFFSSNRFVDLLEFADDILHCKNVIVYFDKTRSDRAALVKTFMFLGFHILSPENILLSSIDQHSDQLSMVYIIDSDD
jgi:hypothetical protein